LIFASLYQDKEVKKKSMINEENTFKHLVPEISGLYSNDSSVTLQQAGCPTIMDGLNLTS
jgi:hypothetical protein